MGGNGALQAPQRPVLARCFAGTRFFCPQLAQMRMTGKSGLPYEIVSNVNRSAAVRVWHSLTVHSFNGDRIRRGSDCPRDWQWRGAEEKLVHVILCAVERK